MCNKKIPTQEATNEK